MSMVKMEKKPNGWLRLLMPALVLLLHLLLLLLLWQMQFLVMVPLQLEVLLLRMSLLGLMGLLSWCCLGWGCLGWACFSWGCLTWGCLAWGCLVGSFMVSAQVGCLDPIWLGGVLRLVPILGCIAFCYLWVLGRADLRLDLGANRHRHSQLWQQCLQLLCFRGELRSKSGIPHGKKMLWGNDAQYAMPHEGHDLHVVRWSS